MTPAAVAGGRCGDEGPVVESEQGGSCVDVACLTEEVSALVLTGGIDGLDLAPRDEADDVEVVDRAVAKDPATGRDVGRVRRSLIVRERADEVNRAKFTSIDGSLGPPVAGVEASLLSVSWVRAIVSSSVAATGFSQNVGMPAPSACRSSGAWPGVAVAMTKASIPDARSDSMSGAALRPWSAATFLASSASTSATTTSSTASSPARVLA